MHTTPIALVIDDDRIIQMTLRAMLAKLGYQVFTAASRDTGIPLMYEHRPDLILVDVMLRESVDGLEICDEIRSTRGFEHTPMLVLSALAGESDFAAGKLYGADDYLTKPIDQRVLYQRIAAVLHGKGLDHHWPESIQVLAAP